MEGGTSFHFVTDGIEAAVARAREVAGEADVSIGGGASTLQQAIAAGLLDEIVVHQVPLLLGAGERLFDNLAAGAAELELTDVVRGPEALHLTYRVGLDASPHGGALPQPSSLAFCAANSSSVRIPCAFSSPSSLS